MDRFVFIRILNTSVHYTRCLDPRIGQFAITTFVICPTGQKNQLAEETENLDNVISGVEGEVRRSSKSKLIDQAGNLVKIVQQVCRQPMPSLVTGAVPADFLRYIICTPLVSAFLFKKCS